MEKDVFTIKEAQTIVRYRLNTLTKLEEIDFFGIESLKLSPEVFKLPNLKKLFMSNGPKLFSSKGLSRI